MSRKALLGLVLLGWALRLLPCLWYDMDYDEGVDYSIAALCVRGVLPYRDAVFVHPPGLIYALLPVAWLPPDWGWMAARLGMTALGAVNIWLLARLSARSLGTSAGYLTALCYAIYPEAASTERRILLEPVLSFCVLGFLSTRSWKAVWWGGCALCVKLWGALWLFSSLPRLRGWAVLAGVLGILLCLPLVLPAPAEFYRDVFYFQMHRPSHGSDSVFTRLWDIFDPRHLAITILAWVGFWRNRQRMDPVGLQLALAWVLLVTVFFFAPGHFFHYNSQLALPECFWAGAAADLVWRHRRVALLWLLVPFSFVLANCMRTDIEAIQRAQTIREHIPAGETVFAFEPGVLLRAGRLPASDGGGPVIADSYGTMLIDAGPGHASVIEAMASPASRTRVNQRLARSRWIVVDDRAFEQVSYDWCRFHYRPKYGDLWLVR